MCHRYYELDVSGTLTAHFLLRHLHAAAVTHDALIANALIFAAGTLEILRRTEDALAEETVALRLVSAVVDGLRLGYLTVGVLQNVLRRRQTDSNLGEVILYLVVFLECHILCCNFTIYGLVKLSIRINQV